MIGYHRALPATLAALATRTVSANVEPSNQQSFADELTSNLYTKANECSSALGVSMAFSLVYPGCTDDGITEIKDVMGYPDDTNMQLVWEDQTQRMLQASRGGCAEGAFCNADAPLLQIANSVWFDDGDTLNTSYEAVVGEYAKQIDFEAADSPVIVNEWVSDSTNGLIDSIVDESKPLFPPYVLLAINSIYLKASWAEQFSKYKTNLDSFYASSAKDVNEASDAHFMNMVEYFPYSHDMVHGYQVIDLPFAASNMSMIFALPMNDNVDAITSIDLITALSNLSSTRVALSVPKFKFESKYDDGLKDALMSTGITAPFTEGSGALCGIFKNAANCEKLIIDKVVQKTVVDVNEEGVEAAAVTMVGVSMTSAGPQDTNDPVLMVLDHPFQFFIHDKSEDLVLFEGRLGEPELPEGTLAIGLMGGKHSDSDFWLNNFGVTPVDPPDVVVIVSETPGPTLSPVVEPSMPPILAASVDPAEHQKFADDLTTIIYTKANECSSALGVSMAFSLLFPGCTDDGITEVRDVMRYPAGSNMQLVWEGATQRMLSASAGQCIAAGYLDTCEEDAPLLQIANSVWLDNDDTLNQEYALVVGDYAIQIDFKADDSPIIVNEWVKNSTNGLIDSIVDESKPLFPPYVLLAVNSIYLKARWNEQFEERFTNLDSFYASASRNDQVAEAHFMNIVEEFHYSHDALSGFQVIDLPFATSEMSMIFVLPMSDDSQAVVESSDLIPTLDSLLYTRVALSVPKFKFESQYKENLKDALKQLGIVAPFTMGAGALCGLFEDVTDCENIFIGDVIQKTVIEVNEKGVEAAAVTVAMAVVGSVPGVDPNAPPLMILDHPFQFFIYDKSEDLVLFEGRVGEPEVPETEPAVPLLDAAHSDPDFWTSNFYYNSVDPVDPSAVDEMPLTTDNPTSSPTKRATISSTIAPTNKATDSSTTEPTLASGPSTSPSPTNPATSGSTIGPTNEAADSSTTEPTLASGPSTSTSPTNPATSGSTIGPTNKAADSSTTEPTLASGSSTSPSPTNPTTSGSTIGPTNKATGSSTTEPTLPSETAAVSSQPSVVPDSSSTTLPTTASVSSVTSNPSMASDPTSPPSRKPDTSSGTGVTTKRVISLLAFMVLASALVFSR